MSTFPPVHSSRSPAKHLASKRLASAILPALALFAALSPLASSASAQERGAIANPPVLPMQRGIVPKANLLGLPLSKPVMSNKAQLDLRVVYTNNELYNPATGRYDKVRLRSYAGTNVDPKAPFVAPTIEVMPGDSVRIKLRNELPVDPTCASDHHGSMNEPHCFNGTNLHTHGLWVSPSGNSDNVLLKINSGVSFEYEYNVPPDHPAGTFWYHPHLHGSTALQVASGMAGALIVRGDRLPANGTNGDIDTLLKKKDGSAFTERTLVLQQIPYTCLDKDGVIKGTAGKNPATGVDTIIDWTCGPTDVGVIDGYHDAKGNPIFGPGTWEGSGRYTSINGEVFSTIKGAKAGDVERWRVVHAGVRDTINLEFRKLKPGVSPEKPKLAASQEDKFVDENCTGDPVDYHVIAADGLTMAKAQKQSQTVLQPGYRNDLLIAFPEKGTYCVVDAAASAAGNVDGVKPSRRILAFLPVTGEAKLPVVDGKPNTTRHLINELVAAAERTMPDTVRRQVVDDLKNGLKLTKFVPRPDVLDGEVTGQQFLSFYIDGVNAPQLVFGVNNSADNPDSKAYDPTRVDRALTLGGVDEWTLQSHVVGHPFHIHVNPFQIVKVLNPDGKDISDPGAVDDLDPQDKQFAGLKGVWKDTIWLKSLINGLAAKGVTEKQFIEQNPRKIYTVVMRTRYERYVGEFVLHCHILDHEDQGMMQNVRIALPDGAGGVTAHGH